MLRVVLIAIVVFATIYALVDCVQTDRRRVRVMPKPVWLLAILVPVAGPLSLVPRRARRARGAGRPAARVADPRGHAVLTTTRTSCAASDHRLTRPDERQPAAEGTLRRPMATLSQWIEGARPRTLPAAVSPILVGTGAAYQAGHVVWAYAILALAVALLLQVGVNYANDYSDGIRGTDEVRVGPVRLVGPAPRRAPLGQDRGLHGLLLRRRCSGSPSSASPGCG